MIQISFGSNFCAIHFTCHLLQPTDRGDCYSFMRRRKVMSSQISTRTFFANVKQCRCFRHDDNERDSMLEIRDMASLCFFVLWKGRFTGRGSTCRSYDFGTSFSFIVISLGWNTVEQWLFPWSVSKLFFLLLFFFVWLITYSLSQFPWLKKSFQVKIKCKIRRQKFFLTTSNLFTGYSVFIFWETEIVVNDKGRTLAIARHFHELSWQVVIS